MIDSRVRRASPACPSAPRHHRRLEPQPVPFQYLPRIVYLAMDSVAEGPGASQIIPYVERLSVMGFDVTLYTFEKSPASPDTRERLRRAGTHWEPLAFGAPGPRGGLSRVARAAQRVAANPGALVHARSDLAAAATMLARAPRWVWDIRSFWTDHRIDMGLIDPRSPEARLMRRVEKRAAASSSAIITLAGHAIPVLGDRFGPQAAAKTTVIPTCVDLSRFTSSPLPKGPTILLLSGSLSPYYDVPAMVRFADMARDSLGARLHVLTRNASMWDGLISRHADHQAAATPEEMPEWVASAHVGLSICRNDVGSSRHAAMPTKIGEFLAAGRPVVVNRSLGDMDDIVAEFACGVVVKGQTDASLDRAVHELGALLADPALPERCRAAAETHFSLDVGVARLARIYRSIRS
jgi:glycosyltransferase involved in cell wall biosynthesis